MTTTVPSDTQRSWTETPPLSPAIRRWSSEFIANQNWLEPIADSMQQSIHKIYSGPPQGWRRKLKDILNGTWLGHPVHPAITDIPIGSWTATLVLDTIWLFTESDEMAVGADATLLLGLLGSVGAAATGFTNWVDIDGADRRTGIFHALLNSSVTASNLTSYLLRRVGMRRTAILLSGIGYMVAGYSASLGGEISYAKGIGVNHTAWEGGSDDYRPVLKESELPENKLVRVDASGIPAVLYKQGKNIYAIAATCSHLAGPLDEGTVENCIVSCPWHGSRFDLRDGTVVESPAVYAQPVFGVRVRDGQIELRRLVQS